MSFEKESIFDNAIIQDEIASYLTTLQLSQCTRVSTQFYRAFHRRLWRTLTLDTPLQQQMSPLFTIKKYTREMSMFSGSFEICSWLMSTQFDQLHSLTCEIPQTGMDCAALSSQVLNFVAGNPTLGKMTLLFLKSSAPAADALRQLEQTIRPPQTKNNLKNVRVLWSGEVPETSICSLIASCSHLEKLGLEFQMPQLDSKVLTAATVDTYFVKETFNIQDLDFYIETPSIHVILARLIRLCPKLKRLEVPTSDGKVLTYNALIETIKAECTPGLKHLNLTCFQGGSEEKIGLLNASPPLKTITLRANCNPSLMPALWRHADTISVLDLSYVGSMKLETLSAITTRFSNLTTLKLGYIGQLRIQTAVQVAEMETTPWTCVKLKELELSLSGKVIENYSVDFIIKQIGRMVGLEKLVLFMAEDRTIHWDAMVDSVVEPKLNKPKAMAPALGADTIAMLDRFLGHWTGLRKVCSFSWSSYFYEANGLTLAQVQWIMHHWKGLEELVGVLRPMGMEGNNEIQAPGLESAEAAVWMRRYHSQVKLEKRVFFNFGMTW